MQMYNVSRVLKNIEKQQQHIPNQTKNCDPKTVTQTEPWILKTVSPQEQIYDCQTVMNNRKKCVFTLCFIQICFCLTQQKQVLDSCLSKNLLPTVTQNPLFLCPCVTRLKTAAHVSMEFITPKQQK